MVEGSTLVIKMVVELEYIWVWCDKLSDLLFGEVCAISAMGKQYMWVGTVCLEERWRGYTLYANLIKCVDQALVLGLECNLKINGGVRSVLPILQDRIPVVLHMKVVPR
jgi:hypothetical protein